MAEVVAAVALVGSVTSAIGQSQSGRAEQQAYEMRARVAEMEAQDFESQAELEKISTDFESQRLRQKMAATQGAQRAAAAASGVGLSGSTQQVIARSAEEQELDALMLRFGGMSRQLGRERSAQLARLNASSLRAEGSVARAQAKSRAFSSLLTGTAGAIGGYYSMGGKIGRETFGIK
mgnify:CR=1 FL=1